MNVCPKCGKKSHTKGLYCQNCGTKLTPDDKERVTQQNKSKSNGFIEGFFKGLRGEIEENNSFDQIKNIAKDVSKGVVNVVGDKYLEIKANSNFDEGKYDEVIKAANEILKLDKFNYEIIILKAKALMKQEKYDDAIEACIEAIAIDDTHIEPFLLIGEINILQLNYDDAVDVYQSVLKKDSKNFSALSGLIKSYFLKKDYNNVNKYCDKVQSLDASKLEPVDYYYWAISLRETGKFKDSKVIMDHAKKLKFKMDFNREISLINEKEFDSLIDKAKEYYNKKNYKESNEFFIKASNLEESKFCAEDYYTWGLCQEKLGNEHKAYLYFKKAYKMNPSDKFNSKLESYDSKIKEKSDNFKNNAIEMYKCEEYQLANDYFKKASLKRVNTMDADDYYMWALSLMKVGRISEAKNKFKQANKLNPTKYSKDQYYYEISYSNNPTILINEAKINFNQEKYTLALRLLDKAIKISKDNAEAYMLKGEILLLTNKCDDSRICFEKAFKLNSNIKFNKIINVAEKCFDKKQYDVALKYMDVVTDFDMKNDYAWALKGDIQIALLNLEESNDCYNKALEINPNNEKAKHGVSFNKSVEYITNPESDGYWLNMGMHELVDGNYGVAQKALTKAIEINPKNALAFQQLGILYHNLQMYDDAVMAHDKSLEIEPNNAQTWFNKGNTMFWMANNKIAIECFEKAIELDPDECDDAYAISGMAYAKLNNMDMAKRCFVTSLAENPTNKFALEGIKYMPGIWDNLEVNAIDHIFASKGDVDPAGFAKIKFIKKMVDELKDKGIKIKFEYNASMDALITYDSKEYFFHQDELEGALVYVSTLWEKHCTN